MKFSFLGYNVEKIMEFGLDLKDLAILRYFDDFRESGKMNYEIIDGDKYYWISYKNIEEELPFLALGKRSIMVRMLKLRDLGILSHYTKKEGGTFSYYSPGEKYPELLYKNNADNADEYNDKNHYEINGKPSKTDLFDNKNNKCQCCNFDDKKINKVIANNINNTIGQTNNSNKINNFNNKFITGITYSTVSNDISNVITEEKNKFIHEDNNSMDEDTINLIKNNKYKSNTNLNSVNNDTIINDVSNNNFTTTTVMTSNVSNKSIISNKSITSTKSIPYNKSIISNKITNSKKLITPTKSTISNNSIVSNDKLVLNNGHYNHNYRPIQNKNPKNEHPLSINSDIGYAEKYPTKINLLNNSSTKLNNLYNNIKNNINSIISYLNLKAGVMYKVSNSKTINLVKARLKEGFTVEDFKTVIDKKVKAWKGTAFEQYLTPFTLFGDKFEIYLNQNISNAININSNKQHKNNSNNGYYQNNNTKNLRFHNFKGRDYNYADLEKKLLGWD